MKKIMAFVACIMLLFGVSCGAGGTSSSIVSSSLQVLEPMTLETVGNTDEIAFGNVTLVVPTAGWNKYSEELEEGTVSYLHKENEDVELGILFMTLGGTGLEGITGEQAIETLEKEIEADEEIEIVSLETETVQGNSALRICYNETVARDSLEDTAEENNQTNIYLVATDTGIIMVALVAPETTEIYLADFTSIVDSISFV